MNKALLFFVKKLRLSNPWKFKAPVLMAVPYLAFLMSGDTGRHALIAVVASVTIIVGVAGLGYLSNDLGDREKDAAIQKENATTGLGLGSIALLFILFLTLAIAPWLYLPFTRQSLYLLLLEFFLFYAYAFKPLRLKERSFLGVIADALYAHLVPALLAAYTFYTFTGKRMSQDVLLLSVLCSWQLVLGIRNICFHQLKDYNNDMNSGTSTFVTRYGLRNTTALITRLILPLELLGFLAFVTLVSFIFPLFAALIAAYWLYKLFSERKAIPHFNYRDYAYKFLDDLYIQWIPLAILLLLCFRSIQFLPVLILHGLLFRSELKTLCITRFKLKFLQSS